VRRCIAGFYKVAKREEEREMEERCGDITKDVMEKIVIHNFLKFFPTGLTEFNVMRPARFKYWNTLLFIIFYL
jgi:hypothetical protein